MSETQGKEFKLDIIKNRNIYSMISALLILVGVGFMIYNSNNGLGAFNYDIQFTGGTSIEIAIGEEFENEKISSLMSENIELDSIQVQKIGDNKSVTIKTRSLTQEERIKAVEVFSEEYNITDDDFSILDISATISDEMKRTSFIAVSISCFAMLIYITFRFKDFVVGASAITALVHDALVVLSFYAIFRIPLNDVFIAAVLTVLGYSINATIVIFDRIRENKVKLKYNSDLKEIVNVSINQSLRRSIFTSLTTFFTVIGLYIFGVESVKVFALPIAVGIVCGTYSSIFVAGSLMYTYSNSKKQTSNI